MQILFYANCCPNCKYMMLSASSQPMACMRCHSVTPPNTPIYVMAMRVGYGPGATMMNTPPSRNSYEEAMNAAIEESFEEERDPEPKPASELMSASMYQAVLQQDESCGICLENILAGQEATVTTCCHKISHAECMENTLLVIPCCPYCRWTV